MLVLPLSKKNNKFLESTRLQHTHIPPRSNDRKPMRKLPSQSIETDKTNHNIYLPHHTHNKYTCTQANTVMFVLTKFVNNEYKTKQPQKKQ